MPSGQHLPHPHPPTAAQKRRAPLGFARLGLTSVMAGALALGGCSWNESRSETLGGVVGGIGGAVLGSKMGSGTGRAAATVVGATLGTMWGRDIAKGMGDVDKIFHERTTEETLEYGKPGEEVSWSNPDSGNSGTVAAGETYQNDDGENCRTFETTVNVDGEQRTGEGKACRTQDGQWNVVEEPA